MHTHSIQSMVAANGLINWAHVRRLVSLKFYFSYRIGIIIVVKGVMGRPTTLDKPNSAGWLCKHIVIILVDHEYSFFFCGPSDESRYR